MNLSEVIREYKQRNGGFQVVPFAAESVRQARKSAHPHSSENMTRYCQRQGLRRFGKKLSAERMMAEVKVRLRKLRGSILVFRDRRDSGEPFPGTRPKHSQPSA